MAHKTRHVLVLGEPTTSDRALGHELQTLFEATGAEVSRHELPTAASGARRARLPVERDDLVVATSLSMATAVAAWGVPRRRLWAVACPPEWLAPGDNGTYSRSLAATAALVEGFLTRDEAGRESLERALSAHRPRTVVLPPGSTDESRTPDPAAHAARVRAAAAILADRVTVESPRPTRSAVVSGFDLKFARDLASRLDHRTDLDVSLDEWPALDRPSRQTARRTRGADSILAEWARPSAVWLSRRKRRGQVLVVRLHRYELETSYPPQLAVDNVDAVVYIAPMFGRRIADELGWPADKLIYIPNYVDVDWLDRTKLPGARFTLGLVGVEVARKGLHRALHLLSLLRREDLRYTLRVRSVMPWDNPYGWHKPEERAYAARCFERIEQDPLLRDGVFFDPPGRDMARWFRRIGHILSTSNAEGSHTAVAEGMASGAVPVLRPWPGADELYSGEWIHATAEAAASAVSKCVDEPGWLERADRARAEVRRSHHPGAVVAAWADLLHGDVPAARAHVAAATTPGGTASCEGIA